MEYELKEKNVALDVNQDVMGSKNQFRALFLKNASLQKRQKCTNCCQISLPLFIVVIIGVANVLINNSIPKGDENKIITPPIEYVNSYVRSFPYYIYANKTALDLGELTREGTRTGFWGTVPQQLFNDSQVYTPFALLYADSAALDEQLLQIKKNRNRDQVLYLASGFPTDSTDYQIPISGIVINDVNNNSVSIDYVSNYESDLRYADTDKPRAVIASAINAMTGALFNTALFPQAAYNTYKQGFSRKDITNILDFSGFFAIYFFPFAFSFLLPVYAYGIVLEKQEKLREMMKMNGMHMGHYWIINYLYNMVIYLIMAIIVIILGVIFGLNFFTQTSPAIIFLLFFGWGLNQVSFAFVLSTFFSKARTATIVSYLLTLFSILISFVVNSAVYADKRANSGYLVWPQFAFYRGIYLIGIGCANRLCPKDASNPEFVDIWLILFLEAILFLPLTLYLDVVLPSEFGVRKSPFFVFSWIFKKLRGNQVSEEALITDDGRVTDEIVEDSDVHEERKRVDQFSEDDLRKYPIVIKNLRKQYHDKAAVQDLCLHLTNECFGLLGPNGAGKTTTISMLTGLFMPTGGTGYVSGLDIRYDMDRIHQIMGICPQFDILWEDLSVEETVLFYARLKGVSRDLEVSVMKKTLEEVGLQGKEIMLVKELSGGMKRRLSVAVSLVGNPRVIFLDEPTTGLDPDTRRQLWNVLLQIKQGKCVIITTHSMEEADVLCNRIGIMSRGQLRCLGTNVYLKNKFGEGYSLKVNFDPENTDHVVEGIKQLVPSAVLEENFPGNYTYRIPPKGFKMSELLANMLQGKEKFRIKDWGISQTSLEDVFLNIVRADETADENKPK